MRVPLVLFVLLITLSVIVATESSSSRGQRRMPALAEQIRRRGTPGQRGRRKNIWSYNPGHRSLAFLVAGEVEVASPPTLDTATGGDYRCLGCCGRNVPHSVKVTPRPQISNRVSQTLLRPDGLGVIRAEPNSVIDRCLGCCEDSVAPTPRVTPVTAMTPRGGATTKFGGEKERAAAVSRQRPWQRSGTQRPCTPPHCNPSWRYEASSSSEEIPVMRRPPPRSRPQLLQSRMGRPCRHLGCRSPLGSTGGDSSSSEEDD